MLSGGQRDLNIGTDLDERQKASAEVEAAAAAVLELYRSQFFAAYRAGLAARAQGAPEPEPYRETLMSMSAIKVSLPKAADIRVRLQQLANDLTEAEAQAEADGAETVTVNVLLGYYTPAAGN